MTGPTFNPTTPNQSPSLQNQILNHISSLETLIKQHNEKAEALITPIRLTFSEEEDSSKGKGKEKGATEEMDDDLKKPYKEVLKSPFTRRIIEFSASSHRMPTNLKIYDGSIDSNDHITHFVRAANQGEWEMPTSMRSLWKDLPCEEDAAKIRPNCSGGDADISLYEQCQMSGAGHTICRSSAVTEMMKRADDFIKSEEAYKNTKFPKEEHPEKGQGTPYKGPRLPRVMQSGGPPKVDGYNTYNRRDHYQPYVSLRQQIQRYDKGRFKNRRQEVNQLNLETMIKRPKEILATELLLQLPPCPPMIGTPRKENLDRYCDYHGEKGHYTNDCYQFKRQLEAALESEKLNHLIKDVRQRGGNRGKQTRNNNTHGKIINMVYKRGDSRKRKFQKKRDDDWMNAPITFPSIPSDDVSASDVRTLLPQPVSEYSNPFNANPHGASRVLWGTITPNRENRFGSHVREQRVMPGGHDEIHGSTSGIPIQHHLGANGDERASGHLIHHPCNDEISHPKGNRNIEGAVESGESSTEEEVMINLACPDQKVTIGTQFSSDCRLQLINLLKDNKDVFVWQPVDMVEVLGPKKSKAVTKEMKEWIKAVRAVKEDLKIEAVMGFPFKFFLDAYKAYHQIQMSKEDEEKMAFYTNQGTYCYTKMPFGLKNVGETYQRLVDSAFQTQLGRNLEAYVDDMVIKSKTERDMIMDVAKTFDNLKKVNMKLNSKKCSFGVKGGSSSVIWLHQKEFEPTPRRRRQWLTCNPENSKRNAKLKWQAGGTQSIPISVCRIESIPRVEEANYETTDVNHSRPEGDTIRIPCRVKRSSKWGPNSRQKGKANAVRTTEFVASNNGMAKYLAKAKELSTLFKKFSIENVPQNQNQKADVLMLRGRYLVGERKRSKDLLDENRPVRDGRWNSIQELISISDVKMCGPTPSKLHNKGGSRKSMRNACRSTIGIAKDNEL
ncbi:reverse transcriptase domain-containing protein [Tanacetum coccineum]